MCGDRERAVFDEAAGVAQVGVDHGCIRVALENHPGVRDDNGVDVHPQPPANQIRRARGGARGVLDRGKARFHLFVETSTLIRERD